MGGSCVDELGAAAGGMVIALETLIGELPRMKILPRFSNIQIPEKITVLVQGFGAVGAHVGRFLLERIPGAQVVGISDALGYLYDEGGLPIDSLYRLWEEEGQLSRTYFTKVLLSDHWGVSRTKYSSAPNDLLRESAFCLMPSSPVANYLDVDKSTQPSMTTEWMGDWVVIVEGANTYSPEKSRKAARTRMEREVYRSRGILIATDYLVNSGGVIFAVQERLIKTPPELRIPEGLLGNYSAIEEWLKEHKSELKGLAEERRRAAEIRREEVIKRNMRELVELLVSDADLLPCEAAERISIQRVAKRERDRTAADIMVEIPTIEIGRTLREAALELIETGSSILAVVSSEGNLVGVITEWDITRAASQGGVENLPINQIMSSTVIAASPTDTIADVIKKLEHNEITAMPVIDGETVLGMVNADLLAKKSLLRLLQSQVE